MEQESPYARPPLPQADPSAPPPMPSMPPMMAPTYYIPTADDRSMAMLCHLLSILTGFLGPLILWLVKKETSPFVDHHGREALNFQITVFLAMFLLTSMMVVLMFVVIGFFLFPLVIVVGILALVAEIMACAAANRGEWHRYPWCIRIF